MIILSLNEHIIEFLLILLVNNLYIFISIFSLNMLLSLVLLLISNF